MRDQANSALERQLLTILAADISGYSHLMEVDESGTFARLHRAREIIKTKIDQGQGRIANTAGDSVIAGFSSPVDAVNCAMAIQTALSESDINAGHREPLLFRIGLNLGDVIIGDGGDVFGDGVNVAARLQAMAEPGRVVISRNVRDLIEGKTDFQLVSRGQQRFKNIGPKIETFAVLPANAPWLSRIMTADFAPVSSIRTRSSMLLGGSLAAIFLGGLLFDHWIVWIALACAWVVTNGLINRVVHDADTRHIAHLGEVIVFLGLINLAARSGSAWFIYPSIPLLVLIAMRLMKQSKT